MIIYNKKMKILKCVENSETKYLTQTQSLQTRFQKEKKIDEQPWRRRLAKSRTTPARPRIQCPRSPNPHPTASGTAAAPSQIHKCVSFGINDVKQSLP